MEGKQGKIVINGKQEKRISFSFMMSSVSLLLFLVMIVRNEIIFKEFSTQETRLSSLQQEVDRLSGLVATLSLREQHSVPGTRQRRQIQKKSASPITINDVRQEVLRLINVYKGPPGPPGRRGSRGKRGKIGLKGKRGSPGSIGHPGKQGKQGMIGLQGPRGLMGPKGDKGDKGDPGPIGPPGLSISKPDVNVTPSKLKVNVDQSASFFCSASGNPKPKLSWERNGKAIPSKWDMEKNGRLVIKQAKYMDAGNMTCVAKNILGTSRRDVSIEVQGPPVFVTFPNSQVSVAKSCDVVMNCTAVGYPIPEITWSRPFKSLPSRAIVHKNGTIVLKMYNPLDGGPYICKGNNTFGEIQHVTHLYSDDAEIECWRMSRVLFSGSWGHVGSTDSISIDVDTEVFLVGYRLWGVYKGRGTHTVTITVRNSQVLASHSGSYVTTSTPNTFEVRFRSPVKLFKGVKYSLLALLKGPSTYGGTGGRSSVVCDGVKVTFSSSSYDENGSGVRIGQIPALIFLKNLPCD